MTPGHPCPTRYAVSQALLSSARPVAARPAGWRLTCQAIPSGTSPCRWGRRWALPVAFQRPRQCSNRGHSNSGAVILRLHCEEPSRLDCPAGRVQHMRSQPEGRAGGPGRVSESAAATRWQPSPAHSPARHHPLCPDPYSLDLMPLYAPCRRVLMRKMMAWRSWCSRCTSLQAARRPR